MRKSSLGTVLVVGATSSLAEAICRELAERGHSLILAGRDQDELTLMNADLAARFSIRSTILTTDLSSPAFSPEAFIAEVEDFDSMIIAVGDMGSGDANDIVDIDRVAHVNYVVPAQLAAIAAEYLKEKRYGLIAIISSVAGDRGRQGYPAYGSAKAALTSFASSLRARYAGTFLHVLTVKPGFVDTPMTWGMKSALIASRESVAKKIIAAMEKRKNVVYVPWFWRCIMLIIRHIPESIFKRLKI